jgi:hypothetical protein
VDLPFTDVYMTLARRASIAILAFATVATLPAQQRFDYVVRDRAPAVKARLGL